MINQILTDQQLDTFGEVVNIAVGKAAEILSLMIERKISLEVPKIELLFKADLLTHFEQRFGQDALGVSIEYDGLIKGVATLFFEAREGKTLVDQLLAVNREDDWDDWPQDASEASEPQGFTDSDKEAIIEVGNMMINAVLGSVSNLVGGQLNYSPPELNLNYNFKEKFVPYSSDTQAFVIESVFREKETQIDGLLVLYFEFGRSLDSFLLKLDQLFQSNDLGDDEF